MFDEKSEPKRIVLDEKLFCHIQQDAWLIGSVGLEGNQFQNTIGYLQEFMINYVADKRNVVSPELENLMASCNGLVQIEDKVLKLRGMSPEKGLKTLAHIAKNIKDDITRLKLGQRLLIPGGWLGVSGGHAMVYEWSLDENGDYLFTIHNSGAGLNFHEKLSTKEKQLYNPRLTYKIKKSELESNQEFVQDILGQLINEQLPQRLLPPERTRNPAFLYTKIFQRLTFLGAKIVSNINDEKQKDIYKWYTAGQISGTCAQKSLHQMLKASFSNTDEYRRFIYKFKFYAFKQYWEQLENEGEILNPAYYEELKTTIHHLISLQLRQRENSDAPLFIDEEKQIDYTFLNNCLTALRNKPQYKEQKEKEALVEPNKFHTNIRVDLTKLAPQPPPRSKPAQEEKLFNEESFANSNFSDDLENVVNLCRSKNDRDTIALLESFFLNLPLPDKDNFKSQLLPYYQNIKDISRCYKQIVDLREIYNRSCKNIFGPETVLPRMYWSHMSLFTIVGHLDCNYSEVRPDKYYDIISPSMSILGGNNTPIQLASGDPKIDSRLMQIKQLHQMTVTREKDEREKDFGVPDFIKYYNDILNLKKFENLKIKLERL